MARKIVNLLSSLLTVLAASALAASAAQAGEFTSASEATVYEGESTSAQVFTGTEPLAIGCATATFVGEVEGTSSPEDLEITPAYRNCEAFGGFPITVDFSTCLLLLTADGVPHSTVHLECAEPGDTVDVAVYLDPVHSEVLCEIEFSEGAFPGLSYTSDGGNMITLDFTLTGLAYVETGVLCPEPNVEQENGTYTGSATVFGFDALTLEPTNIAVDPF